MSSLNYNYVSDNLKDEFDLLVEGFNERIKFGEVINESELILEVKRLVDKELIKKVIKRKNTLSVLFDLEESYGSREGELKEVKLTFRLKENEESGKKEVESVAYHGITLERDFEYYLYEN